MITSVRIKDNTKSPLTYISHLDNFENGKEYHFHKGVNVIVGANGSGKSTLIQLIALYTFCSTQYCSKLPNLHDTNDAIRFGKMFDSSSKFNDGIDVYSDYKYVTYNYMMPDELQKKNIALKSIENATLCFNTSTLSTGERTDTTLGTLFTNAFKKKDVAFRIHDFGQYMKGLNSFWEARLQSAIQYYNAHQVDTDEAYTFLIDEPDRNLDIEKIQVLYDILSYQKEMTQIICVLHNPILIYQLAKLDYIHFIEFTPHYLDSIQKLIANL